MWADFLLAVAASTVVATIINQLFQIGREHSGRKEAARLSALYAIVALEDYYQKCASFLSEKEDHISSNGCAGENVCSLPDLLDYPEEIDWKRLGIRFTERMFAFRIGLREAQGLISYSYNFDSPDGGDTYVRELLATKGLDALQLARDIQFEFKLVGLVDDGEHRSEVFLSRTLDRVLEQRADSQEQQAKSVASLMAAAKR